MMTLIMGGSGSGKSAYAEEYFSGQAADCLCYYIATMKVSDEESLARVERHRKLRENRGFLTVEQPVQIEDALENMGDCAEKKAALVECLSNLVANEMFSGEAVQEFMELETRLLEGFALLKRQTAHLVVVTNNVFEDGLCYEEGTLAYIRVLGRLNQRLAELSDRVIEVVAGIPVLVKGEKKNGIS